MLQTEIRSIYPAPPFISNIHIGNKNTKQLSRRRYSSRFFRHSGTTLIAAEKLERSCITFDRDPVFEELAIRRLERYRKTGWQWENPFP